MTLWHLTFPLARHRTVTPAFDAFDTGGAAGRTEDAGRAALALIAIWGVGPRDRALRGWCPGRESLASAEIDYRKWWRETAAREAA